MKLVPIFLFANTGTCLFDGLMYHLQLNANGELRKHLRYCNEYFIEVE